MALKDYYDRINHVGVPTEDMAATVRFYTDLGFTLIYETKNGTARTSKQHLKKRKSFRIKSLKGSPLSHSGITESVTSSSKDRIKK